MRSLVKLMMKVVPAAIIMIAISTYLIPAYADQKASDKEAAAYVEQAEETLVSPEDTVASSSSVAASETSEEEEEEEEEAPAPEYPEMDLSQYSEAENFVGVLYIPAANILYPVMRGEEYIHEDVNGNTSNCGSIYVEDAFDLESVHNFVFGHNMHNGSMFGSLKESFMDQDNLGAEVYFYTMDKVYGYKVTTAEVKKAGQITSEYGVVDGEHTITLYTCYGVAGQSGKNAQKLLVTATENFCVAR